jgi:hypothetical protein
MTYGNNKDNYSIHKGGINNVTNVAARKSILMRANALKTENGFRWTRRQENRIDVNNDVVLARKKTGKKIG